MTNTPPVIDNPDNVLVNAGGGTVELYIAVPTDADGDPLAITLDTIPSYGSLRYFDGASWHTATAGQSLTGSELASLRYTPPASGDHAGEDIAYTVDDGTAQVHGTIHVSVDGDEVAPGTLFFAAQNTPSELNPDIYTIDQNGTLAAAPMSAPNGSLAGSDGGFFGFDGALYFNAFSAPTGIALFRMDGSGVAAPVSDGLGGYFSDTGTDAHFTQFDGSLYFRGISSLGDELIKLDANGTAQTIVLHSGGQTADAGANGGFTAFDGGLWFSAITDGNTLGNPDLVRLNSDDSFNVISTRAAGNEAFGSLAGEDGGFIVFNGALYFNAYSDPLGDTLFKVDAGTTTAVLVDPSGTTLTHTPTSADSSSGFHVFNGSLWFNEFSSSVGNDTLFQLDTSGTLTAYTYNTEALNGAGALGGYTDFAGATYFAATTASDGTQLFKLDTSGTITEMTNTVGGAFDDNLVSGFTVFNGSLYFDAYNGVGGDNLYKLDSLGNITTVDLGTGNGTTNAGVGPTSGGFHVSNGSLFFSSYTADGDELVQIDSSGTVTVYDINPGAGANSFAGASGFGDLPERFKAGTGGEDIMVASKHGETLDGLGGNDVLSGGIGTDSLNGGDGGDTIFAGSGTESINGGDGNDFLQFTRAALGADDTVDGGAGRDNLVLRGDYSGGLSLSGVTNIERLTLKDGFSYDLTSANSTVAAAGLLTVLADTLTGAHALSFDGSSETDGRFRITAGGGDDTLIGGTGNDNLSGGGGADRLVGGAGADALSGGPGADVFVYNGAADSTSAAYDKISDFNANTDHFDLGFAVQAIDATLSVHKVAQLDVKFDAAHLGVHDAALATIGTHTFLVIDVNGVAGYQNGQDLVIQVDGMTGTLSTGDFV